MRVAGRPADELLLEAAAPVGEAADEIDGEARGGIQVIDLHSGAVAHWVRFDGMVTELYDVAVLPGVTRPMSFGFKTDEIQRVIAIGDAQPL